MRPGALRLVLTLLAVTAVVAVGSPRSGETAPTDLIFIISAEAPVHAMSVDDLQNIYLGKKRVADGFPVYAVDHSETEPIKRDFLEHVLRMTHSQYREQLLRRRFQDGAVTPKFVANSEETLKAVRETPGAIGYIYESEVGTMLGLKVVATVPTK
jgi:ABC-type phosphate transport system substrate-binding protein